MATGRHWSIESLHDAVIIEHRWAASRPSATRVTSKMPDRLSLMLDSMILAVDEGHSYDGVVSIPEMGLEDVTYRSGLIGLLEDGVELLRKTTAAISRTVAKLLCKAIRPPSQQASSRQPRRRVLQSPDFRQPRKESGDPPSQGDNIQVQPRPDARDPRLRGDRGSEVQPRKDEDIADPAIDQSSEDMNAKGLAGQGGQSARQSPDPRKRNVEYEGEKGRPRKKE